MAAESVPVEEITHRVTHLGCGSSHSMCRLGATPSCRAVVGRIRPRSAGRARKPFLYLFTCLETASSRIKPFTFLAERALLGTLPPVVDRSRKLSEGLLNHLRGLRYEVLRC
jgi:hypothetical protein